MYFHLDCLCLAVHACALFSGLPDAQGWIQHVWDHVERPSFRECLPKPDVSLLSWSSVDALRCILPSGLYLVLHQFSALHSYTPHKLQSHRGLTPGWGPAGLWGAHKPSLSLLAQPEAQPRAAGSPQLSLSTQPWVWTGAGATSSVCQGAAAVVTKGAVSELLRALPASGQAVPLKPAWNIRAGPCHSYFMLPYSSKQWRLSQHICLCCLLIKSYLITTFWSQ